MNLEEALLKLSPKNGDIVFVDREAVDVESLRAIVTTDPDSEDVWFVLVELSPGMTLADVVRSASRADIKAILGGELEAKS